MSHSNNPASTQLVKEYVTSFPSTPSKTLGRKLYNEHPLVFNTLNAAYCAVRYQRGSLGKAHREDSPSLSVNTTPDPDNPFNLPTSDEILPMPYALPLDRTLILSDLHIPYHSIPAITTALTYGKEHDAQTILLNGDTADHHRLSFWEHDPQSRNFKEERKAVNEFLRRLRDIFPSAKIILKMGNHDELIERYVMAKAAEIYDEEIFSLNNLWHLRPLNIDLVGDKRILTLGDLNIIHGHELPRGISRPVSPARTLFVRCKAKTICGHFHQTSFNNEVGIDHLSLSTYSTGCLCTLEPKYAPLNNWNHGFAFVTVEDGVTHVENVRIQNGAIIS